MSQQIGSAPGPEYSNVTETFTWVGDFLGNGNAQIAWAPEITDVGMYMFYSLPATGVGRDYFMSKTDQEPQIGQLDFNTKRNSIGWVGAFADTKRSSVLFYDVHSDDWWLLSGQPTGGVPQFTATKVGNTVGFGHAINDGRPFWTGDFDGDGLDEVLFYFPGDGAWWLGKIVSGQLTWTVVGNTPFSEIGVGFRTWSGRFTQTKQTEVLFSLTNDYWMLYTLNGSQLVRHGVGSTAGFGTVNDGRPFWVGNFAGDGIDEVLFYYPGDDNWWMARFVPGTTENPACPPLRQDIVNLKILIAQIQAEQTAAVNSDDRSVLKTLAKELKQAQSDLAAKQTQMAQAGCAATAPNAFGELNWQPVGNTIGYGHGLTSDRRPFWVGRFSQTSQDEILFYYAPLGHWHRGILQGGTIQWALAGTTTNLSIGQYFFGNQAGHAWAGDFDGDGLTELIYRVTGSTDFWMFDFSSVAVAGSKVYSPPASLTSVTVPKVVGNSLMNAETMLSSVSLKGNPFSLDGSIVNQLVVSQDPVGGTSVQAGARVNLGCVGMVIGVSQLIFSNCSNYRLHLWTSNDGDQTWNDEGTLDPSTDPSNPADCPSTTINFSKQASVDFLAADVSSFPDVAPDDPGFDAASMAFRALIPGNPGGVQVAASKSS